MRYTSRVPSRYLEDNTVCYVLLLTYIWLPAEHMEKIVNSNQTGEGHRKRVGEGNIFKSPRYMYWDLPVHSHQSAAFARLQHPRDCVEAEE